MRSLIWKLRIATLWVFYAVAMILVFVLMFMEPGVIDQLRSGGMAEEGPFAGLVAFETMASIETLVWIVIPLAMAFLTFVLKDSVGRWANVVLGAFFGLTMIMDVFGPAPKIFAITVVMVLLVVAGLLIAVLAFMKPKTEIREHSRSDKALAA